MSVRLWDFQCDDCGKRHDRYPYTSEHVPETIECECGGKASWASGEQNHIHNTISSLYGRGIDPQYGCVVESYEHKKRLLREQGMVEGDGPERIDDIMNSGPSGPPEERNPDLEYVEASSDEEALELINRKLQSDPRVDRKRTGDVRTQMLDSGYEL